MTRLRTTLSRWLHALGPVAIVPLGESTRAAIGALLSLGVASAIVASLPYIQATASGFMLIAPFGATAVLVFAAPNSPLAQPWPAIVGNLSSALVAILISTLVPSTIIAAPLSVGLAILVMALCRATHPPGGAVALMIVLMSEQHPVDPSFAIVPVTAGTVLLVLIGAIFARATGRRYPFRHVSDPNRVGTTDPDPVERIGLTEQELSDILVRYRQSLNLGVEDLARLIAAAEIESASHRTGRAIAADIMSRDLVTVTPDAPLREVASQLIRHGFTSLPVVGTDGKFAGVIFQLHLLSRLNEAAHGGRGALARAARSLLGRPGSSAPQRAAEIMDPTPVTAAPGTPVSALLAPLAISGTDAIPIVEDGRIVGIVTQTDLIAALASHSIAAEMPDAEPLPL